MCKNTELHSSAQPAEEHQGLMVQREEEEAVSHLKLLWHEGWVRLHHCFSAAAAASFSCIREPSAQQEELCGTVFYLLLLLQSIKPMLHFNRRFWLLILNLPCLLRGSAAQPRKPLFHQDHTKQWEMPLGLCETASRVTMTT